MRKLIVAFGVAMLVAVSPPSEADQPTVLLNELPIAVHSNKQKGLASWYGDAFQGSATASGEIFDMNRLTAAHPTLPLGTQIRVTNLRNHRSLILRINDRGPYVRGRLLDVSKAAARRLGFLDRGKARVKLEVVKPAKHSMSALVCPGAVPRPGG